MLAAPGAHVAPDVAAWQASLAARLEAWCAELAARLASGEEPPRWAASLGTAPADPVTRDTWAHAVAQVALYRATHRVDDDSLLGPDVPIGSPTSPARAAAARAAAIAEQLASDATSQEPGWQMRHGDAIGPSRRPTQVDQARRPRRP